VELRFTAWSVNFRYSAGFHSHILFCAKISISCR